MNYDDWPFKLMSVSRLKLDPDNPRLIASTRRPTQPELIAELLQHEDVMDLVRDIARLGFFPNEPLVAVVESSNTIVLEGNRRLAALKLLANPDLAPQEYKKRIQQHAANGRTIPGQVRVVMAPSRDSAIALIVARHKGKAIAEWRTVQQIRFIHRRVQGGLSIDEVANETNLDRSEVVKAVRDAKLYDVVLSLDLPDEVRKTVSDPREFNFSTLRRLIDSSAVQMRLGIANDERKGFKTTLGAEPFQRALTRIVSDIATGNVTSRNTNTAEEMETYLAKLDTKPAPKDGAPTVSADEMIDPARTQPATKRHRRTSRPAHTPRSLVPKSFRIDVDSDRCRAVCDELQRLRLPGFPNAVAVTFRTLVEMSVTRYLHENGHLQTIRAQQSKKQQRPADWSPSLSQQLDFIIQTPSIPLAADARRALGKFVSDPRSSLTLDNLHSFTHNRFTPPTPDELRKFWTMLRPLLELTLQINPDEAERKK
jgi:hypothetical protein